MVLPRKFYIMGCSRVFFTRGPAKEAVYGSFPAKPEFLVVYHLHGKPIQFEIVLMVSTISDRKSHSDYALSI
jgi:hypothetical protein